MLVILLFSNLYWGNGFLTYYYSLYEQIGSTFAMPEGVNDGGWNHKSGELSKGDTSRHLLNKASVLTLFQSPYLIPFGSGIYGYWRHAEPVMNNLRSDYDIPNNIMNYGSSIGGGVLEPPRPPALAAMIVETGVVGILLFFTLVGCAVYYSLTYSKQIRRSKFIIRKSFLIIAIIPIVYLLISYFMEITDLTIMYLALIPNGVTYLLTSDKASLNRTDLPDFDLTKK